MTSRTALRLGLAAALATALSACGGSASPGATTTTARIGAQGGVVTTSSGFALSVPAGALSHEIEIEVHEFRPEDGATHRIELEPRGLQLATAAHVEMHHGADDGAMRMVEMENEVEHAMENEHENEVEHSREAEIHHLGVIEIRHARTCVVPCGGGLECDDGICKAHGG
jgi:hypothetical protein